MKHNPDCQTITGATAKARAAQSGGVRIRLLLAVGLIAALSVVSFAGWNDLYMQFLEHSAPTITLIEQPRGIGLSPVRFQMRLHDAESGLDEVVVRVIQRNQAREILRQSLQGRRMADVAIDFPGDKSGFHKGTATMEIRAFDRSLWGNRGEQVVELLIDYTRPRVESVSMMHNVRRGGSQLIFYRALDDNLALSGVKVGNRVFPGFSAKTMDPGFQDPNLFVALFAIPLGYEASEGPVRLFAEDQVGNIQTRPFTHQIMDRPKRKATIPVTEEFLERTVSYAERFPNFKAELAQESAPPTLPADLAPLLRDQLTSFHGLFTIGQAQTENMVQRLLANPRFERYWLSPFQQNPGVVQIAFGDRLTYVLTKATLFESQSIGFDLIFNRNKPEVLTMAEGIVVAAEPLGTLGSTVIIDHGLGLSSIYGSLDSIAVKRGELVPAGTAIGTAGTSGVYRSFGTHIEMRVHGIPVDPLEWWDRNWFHGHITKKIFDTKELLGLR